MSVRVQIFETYRRGKPTYDISSPAVNNRCVGSIKRIEVYNDTPREIQIYATRVGPFGSLSSGFYNKFDEPPYAKRANVGRYKLVALVPPVSYSVVIANTDTREILVQSV